MTTPVFLQTTEVWATLKRLHKKCKRRSIVAVPYVGPDAARQLPLREGDVLICALSLANSRAGNVCPAALVEYQDRGVRVFVRPRLHAKVFLFGQTAVVASANLSHSSEARLDECGMLVSDRKIVNGIKEWLLERMIDPLRASYLDRCEKAWRPPRKGVGSDGEPQRRVWLVSTEVADFPKEEDEVREAGLEAAKKEMTDEGGSYIETIRWTVGDKFAREVKQEDHLVEICDEDRHRLVCSHGRVLSSRRANRRGDVYVYVELPNRGGRWAWSEFRTAARKEGLKLPKNVVARPVPAKFADLVLRWTNVGG